MGPVAVPVVGPVIFFELRSAQTVRNPDAGRGSVLVPVVESVILSIRPPARRAGVGGLGRGRCKRRDSFIYPEIFTG
jgi:hypothetical protein